jgi:ferredoxin
VNRKVINLQPVFEPHNVRNANPKRADEEPEYHGFDFLRIKWLRRTLLWKHTRSVFQVILLLLAAAIIYEGFFGEQFAPKNFATTASWVDYRALLVLSVLVIGGVFCMSCPFVLVSRQIQKRIGRNLPWPGWLKGKWLATGMLLLILWSYEVFSLWESPQLTAVVTLAYFGAAIMVDTFFKGNAFCKYVCPLGLFTQAYSMVAPTEIKSKSFDYCREKCEGKECVNGNSQKQIAGCQTFLYLGTKQSSMDCSYCLDCIRACPHDNIALSLRPVNHELGVNLKKRDFSLAVMALVISFASLFNAAGMVRPFQEFERFIAPNLGFNNYVLTYTIMFVLVLIVAPAFFGWLASWFTQKLAGTDDSLATIFKRYALALLPVSFGVWIAHYLFHFLIGGAGIWPATQNLFVNLGVPVLGQPDWTVANILPREWYNVISPLQVAIIYIGFMISGVSIWKISHKMYRRKVAPRASLAFAGLALLIGTLGILILLQPMQPRGTFGA